ncbi:MAG: glutaredoxin 3 [Alphaproteobacteria bacterium]|nr:MAG: glutaredoxin 3 [Alphaproteobacteria bacterium]
MARIVIYTRMFCGFCTAAKKLLDGKGVEFEEIDASMSPERRKEMAERSGGGRTFPQILINDQPIGGCNELYALDASGELDKLLAQSSPETIS